MINYRVEYTYKNGPNVTVRGCEWREAWDRTHALGVSSSYIYPTETKV